MGDPLTVRHSEEYGKTDALLKKSFLFQRSSCDFLPESPSVSDAALVLSVASSKDIRLVVYFITEEGIRRVLDESLGEDYSVSILVIEVRIYAHTHLRR